DRQGALQFGSEQPVQIEVPGVVESHAAVVQNQAAADIEVLQQDARGAAAIRNIADHDLFIQAVRGENNAAVTRPDLPQRNAAYQAQKRQADRKDFRQLARREKSDAAEQHQARPRGGDDVADSPMRDQQEARGEAARNTAQRRPE